MAALPKGTFEDVSIVVKSAIEWAVANRKEAIVIRVKDGYCVGYISPGVKTSNCSDGFMRMFGQPTPMAPYGAAVFWHTVKYKINKDGTIEENPSYSCKDVGDYFSEEEMISRTVDTLSLWIHNTEPLLIKIREIKEESERLPWNGRGRRWQKELFDLIEEALKQVTAAGCEVEYGYPWAIWKPLLDSVVEVA